MPNYHAPVERICFVIEQVLEAPRSWAGIPAFDGLDGETAREVLEQAARFAQDVLAPLNGPADLEGCGWHDGAVTTPAGFAAAYQAFVAGGWPALACSPEHGGQGLPQLLNAAMSEMLGAANHAWMMYPGLLHGAYEAIKAVATPTLRERYLPKVVSGEWLATMCITEPQAGSDLGLLRTKAYCLGDVGNGAEAIVDGQKIFISGGEHDLTDNIVHLVLARLPDAPAGTKGLSLFLVPKVLPDGSRNAVHCDGIEKKMGIKGSATCQLRFENATGWLLGEPGSGLRTMFLMMNSARLLVGMQGLAHLQAATRYATDYALERPQMRAPRRPDNGAAAAADPIAWHPAVRRVLLKLQAETEAARVLAYWTALLLDEHEHHPETVHRQAAGDLVALLTPIVKAFLTRLGHEGADEALGVLGGHGYVHEWGIEQHVRDSRIAMIYEGTNEIQAIDLVLRKVLDGTDRFDRLLAALAAEATLAEVDPSLAAFATALRAQIDRADRARNHLRKLRDPDLERVLQTADDFLPALGYALFTWAWTRLARKAVEHPDGNECRRLQALARFGLEWILPSQQWRWDSVMTEGRQLPWIDPQR